MLSITEMLTAKVTPYHAWQPSPNAEKPIDVNIEKREEAINKIRDCLSHEPKTVAQIILETGMSSATVYKHIESLGSIRGMGKPNKWVAK